MSTVSGQTIEFFRRAARHLGADPDAFLTGAGIDANAPAPREISWETFAELCDGVQQLAGSASGVEALSEDILASSSMGRITAVLHLVGSPEMLYWATQRWSGPATIPVFGNEFERLPDGRLRLALTIPPHLRDCQSAFALCAGFYRSLPRLLGLPESKVEWSASPRRAVYIVSPPTHMTLASRARQAARMLFSMRTTINELAEQQARLQRQNDELLRANAEAEMARREAVQAREAAEQALDLRRAFLMTVSHELRTPMNGVVGSAELLSNTSLVGDQGELVQQLRESADRMVLLLDELLDFSSIEVRQIELESAAFDLRALVAAVVAHHTAYAHAHHNDIVADFTADLPACVVGDQRRVRQVLDQLVSNAVRFTENGTVTLRIAVESPPRDAKTTLVVTVADTGIGISARDHEAVFEPFVQGERSTTRRFGGLGVGLAVCRRLVQLMGGTMSLSSAPGAGSSFRFTLPVTVTTGPVDQAAIGARTVRPVKYTTLPAVIDSDVGSSRQPPPIDADLPARLRVLVVDDNSTNRLVARRLVEHAGCEVDAVENGEEAVEAVGKVTYDMIFMDCLMPVMDGFEATRVIREMEASSGRHTPIVAITANTQDNDRERCMAAGMDDFLPKPIRPALIEAVLERHCPTVRPSAPSPPSVQL